MNAIVLSSSTAILLWESLAVILVAIFALGVLAKATIKTYYREKRKHLLTLVTPEEPESDIENDKTK